MQKEQEAKKISEGSPDSDRKFSKSYRKVEDLGITVENREEVSCVVGN